MRSGDRAVRPCASERRAPPPLVGPDRGYPAGCRLGRARSDPRSPIPDPRSEGARRWPSVLRMGSGGQNARTVGLLGCAEGEEGAGFEE